MMITCIVIIHDKKEARSWWVTGVLLAVGSGDLMVG